MTAFDAQEVVDELKTLGTVAHISKPFDISKMRELVAQQLTQKNNLITNPYINT